MSTEWRAGDPGHYGCPVWGTIGEAEKEPGGPSGPGPDLPVGFSPPEHSMKGAASPGLLLRLFLLPLHSLFSLAAALFSRILSLHSNLCLERPHPLSSPCFMFLHSTNSHLTYYVSAFMVWSPRAH